MQNIFPYEGIFLQEGLLIIYKSKGKQKNLPLPNYTAFHENNNEGMWKFMLRMRKYYYKEKYLFFKTGKTKKGVKLPNWLLSLTYI